MQSEFTCGNSDEIFVDLSDQIRGVVSPPERMRELTEELIQELSIDLAVIQGRIEGAQMLYAKLQEMSCGSTCDKPGAEAPGQTEAGS